MKGDTMLGIVTLILVTFILISIMFFGGNRVMSFAREEGEEIAEKEIAIKHKNHIYTSQSVQIVYPKDGVQCAVFWAPFSEAGSVDCDWNYKEKQ